MRVILGIGNPGSTYACTRHNVGWFVVDALASAHEGCWEEASGPYREKRLSLGGDFLLLVKPLTYVNRTGEAALAVCERYSVAPSDFLIVVDDVHLPTGELRLRQGGSSGGHNGLCSLELGLGTQKVPRLRIGIGAPLHLGALVGHVLSSFTPEEEPGIREAVRGAAVIAEAFGRGGYAEAATAYSQWREVAASDHSPEGSPLSEP